MAKAENVAKSGTDSSKRCDFQWQRVGPTVATSRTNSGKRWDFQWQREKLTAKVGTEN